MFSGDYPGLGEENIEKNETKDYDEAEHEYS